MCVVIQICSGRYHPVDEAVLNEWNKARNADSGRGERSCDTDPNGDVRFEHLACKELRRFTKAGSVIGLKGLIDKFGDSDRAVYRAWVTLQANPPTVSVSDEQSREREAANVNSYDFVATQVGLLASKSVAQRTVQDLNLANNPAIVPQSGEASGRLRAATDSVLSSLKVVAPEEGQLIRFSYSSTSPPLAALVSPPPEPSSSSPPHPAATSASDATRSASKLKSPRFFKVKPS